MDRMRSPRRWLYQEDPNNASLSPNRRQRIEKSIRSKVYRDKQTKGIQRLKASNQILGRKMMEYWHLSQSLRRKLSNYEKVMEEREDIILFLLGLLDPRERIAVSNYLLEHVSF
ncbi:unnamed protein product [Orchesella dallaii]|uniref:Uncharacterized protein n=1 Tax=Orchesella dallaii TaxID=48710 RepID=A0ABP1RSW2_9HEXA